MRSSGSRLLGAAPASAVLDTMQGKVERRAAGAAALLLHQCHQFGQRSNLLGGHRIAPGPGVDTAQPHRLAPDSSCTEHIIMAFRLVNSFRMAAQSVIRADCAFGAFY